MHQPYVEGVTQHEVFRLGVAALGRSRQPRRADLERVRSVSSLERRAGGPAPLLQIEIARAAHDAVAPHGDEWHALAAVALAKRGRDVALRLLDPVGHAREGIVLSGL